MEGTLALANPPVLGLRRRKETPRSRERAQHPSEGLALGVAMGRGKQRPGTEDVSPALICGICSRHPPMEPLPCSQLRAVLAGLGASCAYLCPSFPLIRVACLEVNRADCPPCPWL